MAEDEKVDAVFEELRGRLRSKAKRKLLRDLSGQLREDEALLALLVSTKSTPAPMMVTFDRRRHDHRFSYGRFDLLLEKATELGVRSIRPVLARRCVADRLNPERARAQVVEAAEQCARTALPELTGVAKLDALLRDWPADRALFFADEAGGAPAQASFAGWNGPAGLLTGPEGGWDDAERAAIRAHPQARPVTLPDPRLERNPRLAPPSSARSPAGPAHWSSKAGCCGANAGVVAARTAPGTVSANLCAALGPFQCHEVIVSSRGRTSGEEVVGSRNGRKLERNKGKRMEDRGPDSPDRRGMAGEPSV